MKGIDEFRTLQSDTLQYANGLILRGMLGTKSYTTEEGNSIIALYVTNKSRSYLSNSE